METSLPELPDDVIHHIFSYILLSNLSNDEVIRCSLLSKQLQRELQTRPTVGFDYHSIRQKRPLEPINAYLLYNEKRYVGGINHVHSTLERYHRENIPLETFTLIVAHLHTLETSRCAAGDDIYYRCIELAARKGLTNLNLKYLYYGYHVLPQPVFEVESLVELTLNNFNLEPEEMVVWPNLKRLRICNCTANDEEVFGKIFRGCPSIEYLKVITSGESLKARGWDRILNFKVANLGNLKKLDFELDGNQRLEVDSAPNLESIEITAGSLDFGTAEYPRLKSMKVTASDQTLVFFINFASRFPILENLYLAECNDLQGINLSSTSLKEIKLVDNKALQAACFDVPNLVHFGYEGKIQTIPKIKFLGNSGRWSSCIKLEEECIDDIDALWLRKLNELLSELNWSETSITVSIMGTGGFFDEVLHPIFIANPGIPVPRIKDFTIGANQSGISLSSVSALLDGVFSMCLPRTITVRVCHNDIPKLLSEKMLLCENLLSKSGQHICSVTDFKVILCTGEEFKLPFKEYWHKCLEALEQDKIVIKQMSYQLEYCSETTPKG